MNFSEKLALIGIMVTIIFGLPTYFSSDEPSDHVTNDFPTVYVEPVTVEIEDNYFEVYTKLKNTLWAHEISAEIAKGTIDDIDGDNIKEVIIGSKGENKDSGKIMVFDWKGSLRWEFNVTTTYNYDGGKSSRLIIDDFEIVDLFNSGKKQIVILCRDSHGWYQSRVCIIDTKGSLLSSYWHPGNMISMKIGSSTDAQQKKIVITGINNDLRSRYPGKEHVFCVFLLDPNNVSGEAPPYLGRIGKGTEEWYGILLPKNVGISRLDIYDWNDDGKNEICVWTSKGHIWCLDFKGNVVGKAVGDSFEGNSTFHLYK